MCIRRCHAAELHLHADLAADGVDVLPHVAAAGVPHETWHDDILAELGDRRRHALLHRTVGVQQPGVVRRVAGLLDGREHVLHQRLKIRRPGDEIRLAVDFNENARRVVGRQPAADQAFARRPAGLLCRAREPALAQDRAGFFEAAVRFGQRVLALHHARACLVAQLLHHVGRDRCRRHFTLRTKKKRRLEAGALYSPSALSPQP
jgi:hypothetical protein